jgi:hypothetical protein
MLEWEAEIDDRAAYLYGLTAEEMKIIRGEQLLCLMAKQQRKNLGF